jgi:DNA adenine methylase
MAKHTKASRVGERNRSLSPHGEKLKVAILHEEAAVYRTNGDSIARRRTTAPPITGLTEKKKLIPFGWYGGKFSHLDWLLPLLPDCHHYCEPFAGSGAVLLNRGPSPVETFNDLDGEVVNFFRILREQKERLVEAIGLTPFSREEFALACEVSPNLSGFERARRFYVRARQVRTGLAQTASIGRWANCKNTSRAGMSGVVSRWLGAVEDLPDVAQRLLRVQIENRPADEVIRLYDAPTTLFYCDPPYVHSTRGDSKAYGFEMTDAQHRDLAKLLNSVQGMVALSNYQAKILDDLYPASKWHKTISPARTNHSTKDKRVEILWTNFDPQKIRRNGSHPHGELFQIS